jgi:hypothetical protein
MSEFTEIEAGIGALETYFQSLGQYLSGTGSLPDTSTIDTDKYEDLVTFCTSQAERAAGFPIGAAQEVVHSLASVSREIAMADYSKAEIFTAAAAEAAEESTYYANFKTYSIGVLKGTPTNGSQC